MMTMTMKTADYYDWRWWWRWKWWICCWWWMRLWCWRQRKIMAIIVLYGERWQWWIRTMMITMMVNDDGWYMMQAGNMIMDDGWRWMVDVIWWTTMRLDSVWWRWWWIMRDWGWRMTPDVWWCMMKDDNVRWWIVMNILRLYNDKWLR